MALIIDTDIGTDIDDAIALAYAIKSGLEIKLITTVHEPAKTRARIAKKLSQQLGAEIPVAMGESKPLRQKQLYKTGLEGKGYIEKEEILDIREDGVDALIETILENKNNVTIASLGPLTNIARAFQKNPDLPKYINNIYVMGNAITTQDRYFLNYRAHNLKVDPEAADIVFNANVPKTIVTTEVCKENWLTKGELKKLKGNPALDYIREAGEKWLNYINYAISYLYDPLVIHHIIDDSVTKKLTYGNVRVTTGTIKPFKENLLKALTGD